MGRPSSFRPVATKWHSESARQRAASASRTDICEVAGTSPLATSAASISNRRTVVGGDNVSRNQPACTANLVPPSTGCFHSRKIQCVHSLRKPAQFSRTCFKSRQAIQATAMAIVHHGSRIGSKAGSSSWCSNGSSPFALGLRFSFLGCNLAVARKADQLIPPRAQPFTPFRFHRVPGLMHRSRAMKKTDGHCLSSRTLS